MPSHFPSNGQEHNDLDAEFDSLRPGGSTAAGATRRTALMAALGVGYAAAAVPVAAQTFVTTPADGLTAGPVTYNVGGFDVPAYAAAPAGKTGLPVVLVVQEIFGVHEHIKDVCRRLAVDMKRLDLGQLEEALGKRSERFLDVRQYAFRQVPFDDVNRAAIFAKRVFVDQRAWLLVGQRDDLSNQALEFFESRRLDGHVEYVGDVAHRDCLHVDVTFEICGPCDAVSVGAGLIEASDCVKGQ